MPYEGDSPTEAWEYWFDEPPSKDVCAGLAERNEKYSASEIVEAIAITGGRCPLITDVQGRLQYLSGVLRREALRRANPLQAEEEFKIDTVRGYWSKKNFTPYPLPRMQAREWLQCLSVDEIRFFIKRSNTLDEVHTSIEDAMVKGRQEQATANSALMTEIEQAASKLTIAPRARNTRS